MTRGRRGWGLVAVLLPMTIVNLMQVARHHADVAAMWPVWRPAILDFTWVMAGAVAVAGVAFGVHAWREGQRHA